MKTSNNTILITGGSAGIGFEIAKLFSVDNKVIITGRNEQRLEAAVARLKGLSGGKGEGMSGTGGAASRKEEGASGKGERASGTGGVTSGTGGVRGIVGDVSDAADVERLVEKLYKEHPDLNVVINNAGVAAGVYDLAGEGVNAFERAQTEMLTNYLSIIRLNEKLLPLLRRQASAAIVNVSSIVSIVPGSRLSTYGASKAALHSYTLSLRHSLAESSVRVFELRPPLVATEFSSEIGGLENGIPAVVVAEDLKKGFENDEYDILVGLTANIYQLYLQSPEQAFLAMQPK